jgi:predicted transcriptional regulator
MVACTMFTQTSVAILNMYALQKQNGNFTATEARVTLEYRSNIYKITKDLKAVGIIKNQHDEGVSRYLVLTEKGLKIAKSLAALHTLGITYKPRPNCSSVGLY